MAFLIGHHPSVIAKCLRSLQDTIIRTRVFSRSETGWNGQDITKSLLKALAQKNKTVDHVWHTPLRDVLANQKCYQEVSHQLCTTIWTVNYPQYKLKPMPIIFPYPLSCTSTSQWLRVLNLWCTAWKTKYTDWKTETSSRPMMFL